VKRYVVGKVLAPSGRFSPHGLYLCSVTNPPLLFATFEVDPKWSPSSQLSVVAPVRMAMLALAETKEENRMKDVKVPNLAE
jgi:hypothetical protein